MSSAAVSVPAPTTALGVRALEHATCARSRAKAYFSELMASELASEYCSAARVVRLLQGGREPELQDWRWLGVLTESDDPERAKMATLALGVLLDGEPLL